MLTLTLSKILEKCIKGRIVQSLDNQNFSANLFGFRTGKSTVQPLSSSCLTLYS